MGKDDLAAWLQAHPEFATIRVAASDLNGQPRGKRVPRRTADKAIDGGTRFPFSVLNLDLWGRDIKASPLVFDMGDADGVLRPTERGFVPMPWLDTPSALLPLWMFHEDGRPFAGDPRHALRAVQDRYLAHGWRPVVAMEMEFCLIDDSGRRLTVPASPRSGKRRMGAETMSIRALDAFDGFFTELYDACEAMDIPADAAISEAGLGQYEINLTHCDDALRAADDAWLFKMLVKGLARRHGFAASFMAKPYPDEAGNGLHTHFSLVDREGRNLFDDGGPQGSELLRRAIAGCLAAMPGCTLIFAPHGSSYDRLVPGAHAPTGIGWGYENRTAAIRVPGGATVARRLEHRVAGGDVNPYLLMAAILGAALNGIEDAATPPAPTKGNHYAQDLPQLPATWEAAMDAFETSAETARIFAPDLRANLLMTKRQEARTLAGMPREDQQASYLDTV